MSYRSPHHDVLAATADRRRPAIIAHRGASALAPENTMLAFRLAIDAGADMIETDARITRDGEVVLIHDADLRRTTGGNGFVADVAMTELSSCDAGYWFAPPGHSDHPYRERGISVPRLSELLELLETAKRPVGANIEIKNQPGEIGYDATDRLASRLVESLRDPGAMTRVLVSSFNPDAIDCVKSLAPEIRTAYLCGPRADVHAKTAFARARGHDAIHPHHSLLKSGEAARRLVDVMHGAGLEVNVWTVNDPQRMQELAAAGVDGIIADDPARLREVVESWAGSA